MNPDSSQSLLNHAWFGLIGLMLVFYVISDGFDLGVGILSLFWRKESDRDLVIQSIGHVWDANETWLVVLGGALFGAFPAAYAMLLSGLYVPIMVLIASLIMRGAAIEFRHAASRSKPFWDCIFGLGSLLAATCQGVILGHVITGMLPGSLNLGFIAITTIGVVAGYLLLGTTWLIGKTTGRLQTVARRYSVFAVIATGATAIIVSIGTALGPVGSGRWEQSGVLHILIPLGILAILAFAYILYSLYMGGERAPLVASVVLFAVSFAGLAISLFPYIIPGQLTVADAASDSTTLTFMLFGIGMVLPIMIGYNIYQYYLFRGKVVSVHH